MALVPDQKFSTFQDGGDVEVNDIIVGLRGGINTKFLYTGELPPGVIVPITNGGTGATTAGQARTNLGVGIGDTPQFAGVKLTSNILDTNGDIIVGISPVASAVNYINIVNAAAGVAPGFIAAGSDANIGIGLVSKGASSSGFFTTGNTGLIFRTGTAYQHITSFNFSNTSATRTVTWQDASGTVAYLSDVAGAVTSITGTASQILANATSATPQTGAVTLTLPSTLVAPGTAQVGNILLSVNTMSVTDTNGNLNLVSNGTGQVLLNNSTSVAIAGLTPSVEINGTSPSGLLISRFINSNAAGRIVTLKSRGATINSLGAVQNADLLGGTYFYADDGSTYNTLTASMDITVTDTVSTGIIPSQVRFSTMDTSGVLRPALILTNDQRTILGNPLQVAYGGLGISTTPTNGQIPIGNGTNYIAAALTAGTGVSITNGAGSITISVSGGGLAIATIAGTTQSAAVNTSYIALNSGQTTVTLPAVYAVGDRIELIGSTANTGGWVLTAAAGDTVRVNNSTTSAGGTVTCTAIAGQCIALVCDVANSSWIMTSTASVLLTTA